MSGSLDSFKILETRDLPESLLFLYPSSPLVKPQHYAAIGEGQLKTNLNPRDLAAQTLLKTRAQMSQTPAQVCLQGLAVRQDRQTPFTFPQWGHI